MKNKDIIKEALDTAIKFNVPVDRYNNIKWTSKLTGNTMRFNFKKNVIRYEIYNDNLKSWAKMKSYSIAKLNFDGWDKQMQYISETMI